MRVLGILLLGLSLPALADRQVTTQIHDIDHGRKPGEETLILLKSGLVAKVKKGKEGLLDSLTSMKSDKNWYTFTLDDDRYIKSFEVSDDEGVAFDPAALPDQKFTYVPTTIPSMDDAKKLHREGRHSPKDSQCFNRAMIWSYEWWKNHSVKSMKILIYFTRTYIRRYNFEWWFHIAPYLHVMDEGTVKEMVMDIKYTSRPHTFRQWTNIFMRNDAPCRVITKYSDYADYPYTGECYIQRTNMYTWQPADLQMNEAWGYTKTQFNMEEVKAAYLEAFDIRL